MHTLILCAAHLAPASTSFFRLPKPHSNCQTSMVIARQRSKQTTAQIKMRLVSSRCTHFSECCGGRRRTAQGRLASQGWSSNFRETRVGAGPTRRGMTCAQRINRLGSSGRQIRNVRPMHAWPGYSATISRRTGGAACGHKKSLESYECEDPACRPRQAGIE